MTPRLALDALQVRAGTRTLLGPVDLDLRAGECLGLVGESGSGKSLTVLSLLGLLPPGLTATGTLRLDGRAIAIDSPEHRALRGRAIAWMPQDPQASLHPLRTVGAQLCESLRALRGLDAAAAKREAIALFERLQLPEPAAMLQRHPHQLSGGQRQRVLLALALAGAPMVLLADEPTSALDPRLAGETLQLLDQLRRDLGLSVLLVSHDLPLVATYAQRVAILRRGELVERGDAAAVFAHPQHEYTRELLAAEHLPPPPQTAPGPLLLDIAALSVAYPRAPACFIATCRPSTPERWAKRSTVGTSCVGTTSRCMSFSRLHRVVCRRRLRSLRIGGSTNSIWIARMAVSATRPTPIPRMAVWLFFTATLRWMVASSRRRVWMPPSSPSPAPPASSRARIPPSRPSWAAR